MGIFSLFFVQRERRTNLALHIRSSAEPTQGRQRAVGNRSRGRQAPARGRARGKESKCGERVPLQKGLRRAAWCGGEFLRLQPNAGGAGAAFEQSVGSGSLREGKAGSGGNSQKV